MNDIACLTPRCALPSRDRDFARPGRPLYSLGPGTGPELPVDFHNNFNIELIRLWTSALPCSLRLTLSIPSKQGSLHRASEQAPDEVLLSDSCGKWQLLIQQPAMLSISALESYITKRSNEELS